MKYVWYVTGQYRLLGVNVKPYEKFEVFVMAQTVRDVLAVIEGNFEAASIWTISRGAEVIE